MMTNDQYKSIVKRLTEVKSENKDLVIKELKKCYPCIGCPENDGLPHGECYGCRE